MTFTNLTPIPSAIFDLARLERESWAARLAAIPAWHPRNESSGGAPAASTGGGAPASAQPQTGAQAPAGQGDVDHLAGLYDLSDAPETLRPHLEAELRKINAGLTPKFKEHDELRQRFEPLANVEGLTDIHPEDLNDLVGFYAAVAQAADEQNPDDEGLYQWWEELGNRFDFFGNGDGEPGGEPGVGEEEQAPSWAQPLLDLPQRIEAIEQKQADQEHRSVTQTEQQTIDAGLKQLADKHNLDEDAQTDIVRLMATYGQLPIDQALQRAWADYCRIAGRAEQALVENGNGKPTPGPTTPAGGQVPAPDADGPMRIGDKRIRQAAVARLQGQSASGAAV